MALEPTTDGRCSPVAPVIDSGSLRA
jgi:hypothetical protein